MRFGLHNLPQICIPGIWTLYLKFFHNPHLRNVLIARTATTMNLYWNYNVRHPLWCMESHSALGDGEMCETVNWVLKTTDLVIRKIREWLSWDNVHWGTESLNKTVLGNNNYCSRNWVGISSVTSRTDLKEKKNQTASIIFTIFQQTSDRAHDVNGAIARSMQHRDVTSTLLLSLRYVGTKML